jgi:PAS domain S-box-containing protein
MSKCVYFAADGEKGLFAKGGEVAAASAMARSTGAPEASDTIFQTLFEEAPDATLVSNARGIILFVNAQTETLFGYTREELQGKPLEALMPERFRKRHEEQRGMYAAAPSFRPMGAGLELYGLRKDGSEFPVEISLSPLRTRSGMVYASGIRDVSDRKRMEGLLQEQLRFETFMCQLSATFVNLCSAEVDGKVSEGLKAIAESMEFDRVCISGVDTSSGKLVVQSSWARPGTPEVTFQGVEEYFPWLVRRVLTAGLCAVGSPEELPAEASVDRKTMTASGEQSLLGILLGVAGQTVGVLSFGTFRKKQEWLPSLVARLQQVADIFTNVLVRKRADQELHSAFTRRFAPLKSGMARLNNSDGCGPPQPETILPQ